MDFQKKDWQFRDVISESELNRMEDGIEEGITKAEQAQDDLAAHINTTTGVHGATSAATPNTIVQRDSAGRFKAAAPSASDDVARLQEINGITTQTINVIPTKNASVSADDYPIGITTFVVSDVNAGWPEATGQVITFKPASYRATQHYASHTGTRNYFRRWDSTNQQWLEWHEFPVLGAVNTFLGIQRFQGRASEDHAGITLYNPDGNLVGAYYYHHPTGRIIMRKYTPSTGEIEADLWLQASEFKYRVGNNSYDIWHSGNVPIETGGWTPELRFGDSTAGITYTFRGGRYTRIANVVYWTFEIELSSKGSATGVATITGLPFSKAPGLGFFHNVGRTRNMTIPSGQWVTSNISSSTMFLSTNAGSNITNVEFANDSVLYASGFYFI